MTTSQEMLLDNPFEPASGKVTFLQKTYPHQASVADLLQALSHQRATDRLLMDETVQELAARLLLLQKDYWHQILALLISSWT